MEQVDNFTTVMSFEINDITVIWPYEDLGATKAYTVGNPHKTLLLRSSHGGFGDSSWVKDEVI